MSGLLLLASCHLIVPYGPDEQDSSVSDTSPADIPVDIPADRPGDLPADAASEMDAPGTDAGLDNGDPCKKKEQCNSGHCVDGVCCNSQCAGTCVSCNAGKPGQCRPLPGGQDPNNECKGAAACGGDVCDGTGKCAPFELTTKSCGASKCTSGTVTRYRCDGKGGCLKQTVFCGGFACDGAACATKCDNTTLPCEAGYYCQGGVCYGSLKNGAACGSNPKACKSGLCVDGVCCNIACLKHCWACNTTKSIGTCAYVPKGQDPRAVCSGEAACGNDVCDGGGKCEPAKTNTECKRQCSGGSLQVTKCTSAGKCKGPVISLCTPYKCLTVTGKDQCGTSCANSNDCISASVCDRSGAHLTGSGVCVTQAKVIAAKPGANALANAILTVSKSKTHSHVRVSAGTYKENLQVTGATVTLIGVGSVKLEPAVTDKPILKISGGSVTLQGLLLNGGGDDGVECEGNEVAGLAPELHVLESTIADNKGKGIKAEDCTLELRRSIIEANGEGGVEVKGGGHTIVNNLVVKNGGTSSSVGGLSLKPSSDSGITKVVTGNTVVDNTISGSAGGMAGVTCAKGVTIYNSVVANNKKQTAMSNLDDCTYYFSLRYPKVTGSGTGNIYKDPLLTSSYKLSSSSPCVNAASTSAANSVLDLSGSQRLKGKLVDMGAYELK